jgi:hypothetical protein
MDLPQNCPLCTVPPALLIAYSHHDDNDATGTHYTLYMYQVLFDCLIELRVPDLNGITQRN